jgi:DNA polymerase III sliding clamp (beta) subunit (PCNA family)
MQITLPTREVRDALTGLARVINSRTSLPILHGVRISASPSGQVRAEATDLDSSASYTFNSASCEGNGAFILGLDLLKPFAQGNGPGTLTFDCADDTRQVNVTTFVGGQALRRTLAGFDPGDWPELRPVDMKTAPVPGFIDAYRTLAPFASTDETRYVLNSVHLDVSEKQADGSVMVATDGRRLACKNHMTLPLDESCVLRTSKFLTWTRLPADAEIGLAKSASGATIGVKAGPWQFTTKAIDGVFPNWRQVVPAYTDVENHVTLSDSDCELLLKALPTLPGDSSVTLVGREGTFAIWAHGVEDKDWTVLQIPGSTYQGAAVAYTTVDRTFLRQALESNLMRDIRFRDELSPILSEDGAGGTHILMPLSGCNAPEEIAEEVGKLRQEAATADVADEAAGADDKHEDVTEPATPAGSVNDEQGEGVPTGEPVNERKTRKGKVTMSENEQKTAGQTGEKPAIERALEAFEQAKAAVRDANAHLITLAAELRNVLRDQKAQSADLDKARGTLAKLQSMSL